MLHGLFLAVVALARSGHGSAAGISLEDHVDHPGDGVRAVLGRCAVTQHFDMVDGTDGDQVQVAWGGAGVDAADVQGGAGVAALAVDQHQHLGGVEPAQVWRAGHAAGVPAGLFRQGQRRYAGAQGFHQARLAGFLQLLGADYVDGHWAAGDSTFFTATVAGDDHRTQGQGSRFVGQCRRGMQAGGEGHGE
ncbi:hypothetical protein D3C81_1627440 [compost metagenome]